MLLRPARQPIKVLLEPVVLKVTISDEVIVTSLETLRLLTCVPLAMKLISPGLVAAPVLRALFTVTVPVPPVPMAIVPDAEVPVVETVH